MKSSLASEIRQSFLLMGLMGGTVSLYVAVGLWAARWLG